jgi:hypothetical protein
MFNPSRMVIAAFVAHSVERYRRSFGEPSSHIRDALARVTKSALATLLDCDCPYHDMEHTLLVTDVGQTLLEGRLARGGDVTPHDWLQAVVAMLHHDIGYVRGLLDGDGTTSFVTDAAGQRVTPGPGATDASLMPYHVTRGALHVQQRLADEPEIDVDTVAAHIEMTRFPVPDANPHGEPQSLSALVRAADLIGQLGDPRYPRKLSRLYTEFVETGEAARLGYGSAEDLRRGFPEFFATQVRPHIGEGLKDLAATPDGQVWAANLFHHVEAARESRPPIPQLVANHK